MFGDDGTVYFCETGGKVRAISTDGYIKTVVGGGSTVWLQNGPATAAQIGLQDIEFGRDGNLYVSDWPMAPPLADGPRIFKVGPPLPGLKLSEILVASEDGSEQYVFTYGGKHLRTLDALTGVTKYTFNYDPQFRLTSIVDVDSLITTIERDTSGKATAIISPYGVRTQLVLDPNGYLLRAINPANESRQFTYTNKGLMTSMTDARGSTYTYTYDSLGYLTKDLDPVGGFTQISRAYDSTGYTVTATTAMGKVTKYRTDQLRDGSKQFTTTDPNGLKTITTDATNGTATSTVPDGSTQPITQKPDPRFGMQSPLSSVTKSTPSGISANVNQNRKITQMTGRAVTGLRDSILLNGKNYKIDWDGNLRKLTKTSPQGRQTFSFFDARGKTIKDSIPGFSAITYKHDNKGRKTESVQGGRKTTFEYDSFGRQSRTIDPSGRSTHFFYDATDRLTKTILPDSCEINFSYDRNGNILKLTPPGRPEHTFEYSDSDLEIQYTPPFAGDSARSTKREHNLDREVMRITRPDSLNTIISYGGQNSLVGQPTTITYDQGTITLKYDTTRGKLTSVISATRDTISYQYDGQLLVKTAWHGTVEGTVSFTYNIDMRISSEKVNGSDSVGYRYDNDGLLTGAGTLKVRTSDVNSLLLSDTLNGIVTNYSYNSLGELLSQETVFGLTSLCRFTIERDSTGRVASKTEGYQSNTVKQAYQYDVQGRLTRVWKNDTIVCIYSYDPSGNRASSVKLNDTIYGDYDAQDRIRSLGSAAFIFSSAGDLRGKIVGADTNVYQYDAMGNLRFARLANGTVIEYIIDGRGHRIGKKVNGKIVRRWIYSDNLRIVAEFDSTGQKISRFVYGTRANVPEYIIRSGIVYRIVTDQVGSVRFVINSIDGTVVQQINYDDFGVILYDCNPGFQPFGFAGGLYDQDTKFTKFGARDYDAAIGRWTTSDKARFEGGQTNFYAYVSNDPINRVDPSGLSSGWTETRLVLASAATLYAYGEVIGAIFDFMNDRNVASLAKIGQIMLAAYAASADVQDAANDAAMEAKGLSGNSNLVGLMLTRAGLSKDQAVCAKAAIYVWNIHNASLFSGALMRRAVDGGLLGFDLADLGKNFAPAATRIIEILLGPFVMRPDAAR